MDIIQLHQLMRDKYATKKRLRMLALLVFLSLVIIALWYAGKWQAHGAG